MDRGPEAPLLNQLATGIPGLDLLLRGGLVEGGMYLVLGRPGSGKTTFGNHLAFNAVARGMDALYVTVMAESHDRMLRHLSGFTFIDLDQVGEHVHYLSVYDELIENGLDGVQATLRRAIRERGYSLVVIDGAGVLEMTATSRLDYSRFISDLSAQMNALGCTTMLLAVNSTGLEEQAIAPYVDGIFVLEDHSAGLQDIRYIHMVKVRGVGHVRGRHRFTINDHGVEVYPRIESILDTPPSISQGWHEQLPTGIAGLDDLLYGGLLEGSITLLRGPSGVGKTILGLQFILAGALQEERCLMATFLETTQALSKITSGVSAQLRPFQESGLAQTFASTNPELPADDWAWRLLEHVEQHKPSRVLIDGISDVTRLRLEEHRVTAFYRALTGHLRSRGITVMFTAEAPGIFSPGMSMRESGLLTMSDNLILMYYTQVVARMHRILSVFKVRGAAHDHSAREFSISNDGIHVNMDEEHAARLLGVARSGGIDYNSVVQLRDEFGATN